MTTVAEARVAPASRYISSPVYDWVLYLAPPLLALVVGALFGWAEWGSELFWIEGRRTSAVSLGIGALINAHLVAVLLRSHGNTSVLRQHPIRFFVVPPLLILLLSVWEAAMIVSTVVVALWDVYHSALQTFGFARIYDRRMGNDPLVGRRLDLGLNLLLYVGPILAGASMIDHLGRLDVLEDVGAAFFTQVPVFMEAEQGTVAWLIIAASVAFVGFYLVSYARLAKRGYAISWQKVFLLATTGLCSVVAWGFNPYGMAFVIMNAFHAIQYLGLVWWSEGARARAAFGFKRLAWLGFLVLVGWYGVWADLVTAEETFSWAVVQTVALMHFWYDGFVWSVRKKQV